jgi:hypothetical protein
MVAVLDQGHLLVHLRRRGIAHAGAEAVQTLRWVGSRVDGRRSLGGIARRRVRGVR